jgi:hypothetical protein
MSIDSDNNVWVSGTEIRNFDKVKGGRWDTPDSGSILVSYPSVDYGGYGGLMDRNGFIWSSKPLLRWDTSKPLNGTKGDPPGPSIGPLASGTNWAGQGNSGKGSYGLCIDSLGNVWNTAHDWYIVKYASNGTYLDKKPHGGKYAQGCAVGLNDDVWVAHSKDGSSSVGHLANNGTYLGTVAVGRGPTGVAVDRAGKVWSTNFDNNTLSRIDPSMNAGVGAVDKTVDLGAGCDPDNYGDMTGREASVLQSPPTSGSWTVIHDYGSVLEPWGSIVWTADTPVGSSLTVQVRNNEANPWTAVQNGQKLSNLNLTGQYLHVRVSFIRAPSGASPALRDLAIGRTVR